MFIERIESAAAFYGVQPGLVVIVVVAATVIIGLLFVVWMRHRPLRDLQRAIEKETGRRLSLRQIRRMSQLVEIYEPASWAEVLVRAHYLRYPKN